MKEEIINLRTQAIARISEIESMEELGALRVNYLGRSGKLTEMIKKISEVEKGQRKEVGILINETKSVINDFISERKNKLKKGKGEWFDDSLPGIPAEMGHLHLVTQAIEEISMIFERIGFVRSRYPEVEWDFYSFGALNFSENHPARDEWETFFVDAPKHSKNGVMLLTPHTSSGQVREMLRAEKPPIRMINISKCYRRQSDMTHVPMLHQFEGLVVDKHINITHLKGTIDYFAKEFYGEGAKSRIRPYNFPFTEPSFEVDFSCVHCDGTGCLSPSQSCKFCKAGWHETGGAGMVHPNVLRAGGIDPNIYSGFAFGWGVERTYLMKPGVGIDDVRTIYSTDLNYLKQF